MVLEGLGRIIVKEVAEPTHEGIVEAAQVGAILHLINHGRVFVGTKEILGGSNLESKNEMSVLSHDRFTTCLSRTRRTHTLIF